MRRGVIVAGSAGAPKGLQARKHAKQTKQAHELKPTNSQTKQLIGGHAWNALDLVHAVRVHELIQQRTRCRSGGCAYAAGAASAAMISAAMISLKPIKTKPRPRPISRADWDYEIKSD